MGDVMLASRVFKDGKTFETIRVPLGVVTGTHEVRIRYLGNPLVGRRDGRSLSVLYSSLVVGRPIERTPARANP